MVGAGTGVIAKMIEQIRQEAPRVEYKVMEIQSVEKSSFNF
ncbi:hypothetical protein ACT3CE_12690 [Marinifilum sp. RC60d5]